MSETTPRPGPELFPQTEQGPANDHRSPYANSRLEHVHADTRLSERTREIALLLLRMPSGIREVTYRGARSAASDPGAWLRPCGSRRRSMSSTRFTRRPSSPRQSRCRTRSAPWSR